MMSPDVSTACLGLSRYLAPPKMRKLVPDVSAACLGLSRYLAPSKIRKPVPGCIRCLSRPVSISCSAEDEKTGPRMYPLLVSACLGLSRYLAPLRMRKQVPTKDPDCERPEKRGSLCAPNTKRLCIQVNKIFFEIKRCGI